MNLFERFVYNVRRLFTVREDDNNMIVGYSSSSLPRDRFDYDRQEILEQALEAYRLNPVARRIVGLTSQYVVGGGMTVSSKSHETQKFIDAFWKHPLNRMSVRIYEWCDELTRSGNLFVILSTDAAGMTYVRSVPAQQVDAIEHKPNDVEQPTWFKLKPDPMNNHEPQLIYQAYNQAEDAVSDDGSFPPVMIQYAINRPVGGQWGESDLAPVLKWLSRYANWLEDRARLNRFRTSFLYQVTSKFASEAERQARQQRLNANPPSSGSILVCDESEVWTVIEPKLDSQDAATDGLALKKMIATGAGIPLHFLAEPESATRTTAEAAGGPTYRHFEQRQNYFTWMIGDLMRVIINRRAMVNRKINKSVEVQVLGADISARDNLTLSMSGSNVMGVATQLRDRKLIDDAELLRISYRFMGELVDGEEMLRRGKVSPDPKQVDPIASDPANQVTADSGKDKNPNATKGGRDKPISKDEEAQAEINAAKEG